ncbi:3502_t:CDS:2, partial [Paraglomus brasilianum]
MNRYPGTGTLILPTNCKISIPILLLSDVVGVVKQLVVDSIVEPPEDPLPPLLLLPPPPPLDSTELGSIM